jgi:L-ascorbate metabolism protein UlaG (beta-lactamase superfamily)|tara:strand:+ start:294 stop:554 length:261 start_codon:yes stop_codon:yes gene_type:complete
MSKPNNYGGAPVTATTSGVELTAQNTQRNALILFNQGPETILVYFDTATNYFEIEANKGVHFPVTPLNQVNAKTTSGTATVSVLEA